VITHGHGSHRSAAVLQATVGQRGVITDGTVALSRWHTTKAVLSLGHSSRPTNPVGAAYQIGGNAE